MMTDIVVGSRVRIRVPDRYTAPLRRLGNEGRVATVESVFVPAGAARTVVRVSFDVKRPKAKPVVEFFSPEELVLADPA